MDNLINLKALDLRINWIESIENIEHLYNLEELELHGNFVIDYNPLLNMKKLKTLSIGNDHPDDEIELSFVKELDDLDDFQGGFIPKTPVIFKSEEKGRNALIEVENDFRTRRGDGLTWIPELRQLF